MKQLQIIRHYDIDDEYCGGDALIVELLIDFKRVLVGDYYHNKIEELIEGFIQGLQYANYEFTQLETININDGKYS